jgi:hypothetical protein
MLNIRRNTPNNWFMKQMLAQQRAEVPTSLTFAQTGSNKVTKLTMHDPKEGIAKVGKSEFGKSDVVGK